MSIFTEKHNGKTIHIVDYSHCQNEKEMIELLEDWAKYQQKQPSKILTLSDVTSLSVGDRFMEKAVSLTIQVFNKKEEKTAIIGISGNKKSLLNQYTVDTGNPMFAFESKEKAIAYLIA